MRYAATVLLLCSSFTQAVKDSAWYWGIETPNVDIPMYWGDMPNIIEDLGNFTNLYVKFHSCAWTQLGGYADQEDNGKEIDEDDYWYMGAMNSGAGGWSYAPQIAFSLYGKLKGSRRGGCNHRTYINSFYTTSGFHAFSNALTNAGVSNNGKSFSMYCQNGMALSCSSKGNGFSFTKFSGDYCAPGYEESEGVTTELTAFNNVLEHATCTEIFDSSMQFVPYLLYQARSCQLNDEAGACPDPFGQKAVYERRLNRALAGLAPGSVKYHHEVVHGYTLLGLGTLFLSMAGILAVYEKFYGPRKQLKTKIIGDSEKTVTLDCEETPTTTLPISRNGDEITSTSTMQSVVFEAATLKCVGESVIEAGLDTIEEGMDTCGTLAGELGPFAKTVNTILDKSNITCSIDTKVSTESGDVDKSLYEEDCDEMDDDIKETVTKEDVAEENTDTPTEAQIDVADALTEEFPLSAEECDPKSPDSTASRKKMFWKK